MNIETQHATRTAIVGLLIATLFGAVGCQDESEPEQEEGRTESSGCTGYEPYAGEQNVLNFAPPRPSESQTVASESTLTLRIEPIDSSRATEDASVTVESDNEASLKVLRVDGSLVTLEAREPGTALLEASYAGLSDQREYTVETPASWSVDYLPQSSEEVDGPAQYWCGARLYSNIGTVGEPSLLTPSDRLHISESARQVQPDSSGTRPILGQRTRPILVEDEVTGATIAELPIGPNGTAEFEVPGDMETPAQLRLRSQQTDADEGLLVHIEQGIESVGFSLTGAASCHFASGEETTACSYPSPVGEVETLVVNAGVMRLKGERCYLNSDACDVSLKIEMFGGTQTETAVEVTDYGCLGEEPVTCTPGECDFAVSSRASISFAQGRGLKVTMSHRGFSGSATLQGRVVRDEETQ